MIRDRLIKYRGDRSQDEMAKMYGVTQQAWSQWEQGIRTPSYLLMRRIANDIGRTIDDIFFANINNK